ncbi:helix-turn-helix domain-containing protein [Paenibacillus polysaccharolyticus]|uniref:helix-turn-helix domain-containing protein n=1 Tax=Paenibacillus polysaccharolyticus TaxID=582692 RepID=UPI00209E1FFE|nr:helix-turn-helix transcriptional regulator [Paenibacillus polysaccharolyticus]MCP1134380.1 helix-turn-helix domain-containing protein [Paenibacillus polysaccharolyticus]
MSDLGSRLKKARMNKRLTQQEVANKIDVSNGAISGYERNYRDPDTETLKKLANLYEVSLDWLNGRDDKEGEYTLPEEVILNVIREAEEEFKVSLRDDPVVESAVRDLLKNLAKMKQATQKND